MVFGSLVANMSTNIQETFKLKMPTVNLIQKLQMKMTAYSPSAPVYAPSEPTYVPSARKYDRSVPSFAPSEPSFAPP